MEDRPGEQTYPTGKEERNADERKEEGRQLNRLGPEPLEGLSWGPSIALPFSLLQGKGRILQGGPKALEHGLPTSHICFPSGSHSWWICIPRLSLQSHNPFKTNRGFSFVATNPCRHLRFSWVVWGPAGFGSANAEPGMESWWQRVEKGSLWREDSGPLALTQRGLGVLA